MNEWKRHKFLLLFGGATTRDSCVQGSRVIHSAPEAGSSPIEKEQKFVLFSFIHNPPYLHPICRISTWKNSQLSLYIIDYGIWLGLPPCISYQTWKNLEVCKRSASRYGLLDLEFRLSSLPRNFSHFFVWCHSSTPPLLTYGAQNRFPTK